MWCDAVRRPWRTPGAPSSLPFPRNRGGISSDRGGCCSPIATVSPMRIAPLWTSCSASRTGFCRPTPSRKPSTTSWMPRPPDRSAASRLLARRLRPTRTSRIQILPQDVAQLEALHTQRFRFSPVQWVYRGLQQRNQDTQKSRLRVQKLPLLQDEDSALAGPLPQHLTKSPKTQHTRPPARGAGVRLPGAERHWPPALPAYSDT